MEDRRTLQIEYADDAIKSLILSHNSTDRRYKKLRSNAEFLRSLDETMAIIRAAQNTSELKYFRRLNYEALKFEMQGLYSVRIGYTSKYRLIFEEFDGGIRIRLIEINEHYGDK